MNKIDCFETDFVYSDYETNEFKNVHIKLNVEEDKFILDIFSEEALLKSEIEDILNQLNDSFFRRLRISITTECDIVVRTNESKNLIKVVDNGVVVKKIIPMED